MKILDAHFHIWQLSRGDYDWITPDQPAWYRDYDLDDWRRSRGSVASGIVVQCAPTGAETDFLLEHAQVCDDVLGVVGWVDLLDDNAPAKLEALAADPHCLGIRPMLQDITDPQWILRPVVLQNLKRAAELELRFDALIQPRHLPFIVQLCDKLPELNVIIDHAAKPVINTAPDEHWCEHLVALGSFPQVYCKYSGLVTEAAPNTTRNLFTPFIEHLITCFGTSRLVWGSDWPVVRSRCEYEAWLRDSLHLLDALGVTDYTPIYSANAQQFYALEANL